VPDELTAAQAHLPQLVSHFSLIQQQMFDQFQQTMTMMMHMFRGLFEDQKAQALEELGRVRDLTVELHTLQGQLNLQTMASAQTGTGSHPAEATSAATTTGSISPSPDASDEPAVSAKSTPSPPKEGTVPEPALAAQSAGPASDERAASPEGAAEAEEAMAACEPAPEHVHFWLLDRMAAIQKEREGRWKKILGFLTSSRP
jgi:hypothetical protein